MVITNTKWWDGLPADVRKGLNEAMKESIVFGNKVANDEDANFRAKVIADNKAKVLPMSKEHLTAWRSAMQPVSWRSAMQPVWKQFEGEIGANLIQAAQKSNK